MNIPLSEIGSAEPRFHLYRVELCSTSGMYAQYDGHVDVFSPSAEQDELFTRAVRELARTSFPDRTSKDFWRFKSARRLS